MALLRLHWLLAIAGLLLAANLIYWLFFHTSGVTLTFTQTPLREVIRAFERQAPVTIHTNLDPQTPITIFVQNAPWPDALETLAVVAEARWFPGYILAPTAAEARAALADWKAGDLPPSWLQFSAGRGAGPGWLTPSVSELAYDGERLHDPRLARWPVQDLDPRELHRFLDQGRFLTDAAFWVPSNWNPILTQPPTPNSVRQVARSLARQAGGAIEEFIILASRPQWTGGPFNSADRPSGNPGGDNSRGGSARPLATPEQIEAWRKLKIETELAALPSDRQATIRQEIEQTRSLLEEIRALPPEQRRERMAALMEDPLFQQRMEQREAARDMRRSPEQRLQRYQRYVDRKRQLAQSQ